MDTSNSENSSTKFDNLDFVLDGGKVNGGKLTPNDWIEVINETLRSVSPILNYLPFLNPDKNALRRRVDGMTRLYFESMEPNEVHLMSGVKPEERICYMGPLFARNDLGWPEADEWKDNILTERFLFKSLSEQEQWIMMTRQFKRTPVDGNRSVECLSFSFEPLSEEGLKLLILGCWGIAPRILKYINLAIEYSIKTKERHITDLRDRSAKIDAVLDRIGF